MKLNLKQVLAAAGIAKPRFDSARRAGRYSFMYEALEGESAVAEYENGRNRFAIEHVVGMVCVDYATEKLGLSVDMADSIVGNNFGELTKAIWDGIIDPDSSDKSPAGNCDNHFHLGALFFVVGRAHYAGTPDWFASKLLEATIRSNCDGHAEDAPAGLVMIDATSVYREVKSKLLVGLGI